MPTLILVADAFGRPLAPHVVIALALALLALLCLLSTAVLGVDPAALDDVGSWRWLPDA